MKTSTKNTIITSIIALICSVISILGTKEYINSKQNQSQLQEQTQNQSIIVNFDGQEFSYESDDVISLNNEISELETENSDLKSENEILKKTNMNLEKDITQYKNELNSMDVVDLKTIQLINNGLEQELTNSTIIFYNNNPYFPFDTLQDIYADSISFDNNNMTIILGKNMPKKEYLLSVCPPYQTDDHYNAPDYMTMSGDTYKKGICMEWSEGFSYYNLKGNYNKLEFDLGHIDGGSMTNGTLEIYLDGEFYKKYDMLCDTMVQHYECELNGANQMQFIWKNGGYYNVINYGMANITIE